jgi:hypothetical protein
MRTVYIETTVVSYLVARPSRDIVIAAHQQITRDWWAKALDRFAAYVSVAVIAEAAKGDADAAKLRLASIQKFDVLEVTAEVRDLAEFYLRELRVPEKAEADCYHLAIAAWNGMDYLISWNMAHIVNGEVIARLQELNDQRGIRTPVICTPEELMEEPWIEIQ